MSKDIGFEEIDRKIEVLEDRLATCRRAMQASRAAMIAAAVVLAVVMTIAGAWRTPPIVFGAIATLIGGLVWLGANKSSQDEIADELSTLDAAKNELIDKVAAQNGWRDLTPTVH